MPPRVFTVFTGNAERSNRDIETGPRSETAVENMGMGREALLQRYFGSSYFIQYHFTENIAVFRKTAIFCFDAYCFLGHQVIKYRYIIYSSV